MLKTKLHPSPRRTRKHAASVSDKAIPGKTIQELARERGARPFDPLAFAGVVPPTEDIDAFVQAIYRART
jgi:hypothetical protein